MGLTELLSFIVFPPVIDSNSDRIIVHEIKAIKDILITVGILPLQRPRHARSTKVASLTGNAIALVSLCVLYLVSPYLDR